MVNIQCIGIIESNVVNIQCIGITELKLDTHTMYRYNKIKKSGKHTMHGYFQINIKVA